MIKGGDYIKHFNHNYESIIYTSTVPRGIVSNLNGISDAMPSIINSLRYDMRGQLMNLNSHINSCNLELQI